MISMSITLLRCDVITGARGLCFVQFKNMLKTPFLPLPLLHLPKGNPLLARFISNKQRLYGNEEGHDKKNEVRKEKWIRKRMRRTMGGDYRENLNLSAQPNQMGPMVDLPDWSFPSGESGYLSEKQKTRRNDQLELCRDVLTAYRMVKEASKM